MDNKNNLTCQKNEDQTLNRYKSIFNFKDSKSISKYVVLFKSLADDGVENYLNLGKNDLEMAFSIIYVMDFKYINQNLLSEALMNFGYFSGMILTSQRTVKAISIVLNDMNDKDRKLCISMWSKKVNYAVGKGTHLLAESLLGIPTSGQDSGNSENLAELIINASFKDSQFNFLFPCSEIRRDTIIERLRTSGVNVKEIISYKPVPRNIKEDWCKIKSTVYEFEKHRGLDKVNPDILIFFSPSSVKFVINELKSSEFKISDYRIIALGPTTGKELLSLGVEAVICESPSLEGVEKALRSLIT